MAYERELEISYEEGLRRAKEAGKEEKFLEYIEYGTLSINEIMSILHLLSALDFEYFESNYAEDDT